MKPVMFSAGVGLLDDRHWVKGSAAPGMLVCVMGGPAYRIGELHGLLCLRLCIFEI